VLLGGINSFSDQEKPVSEDFFAIRKSLEAKGFQKFVYFSYSAVNYPDLYCKGWGDYSCSNTNLTNLFNNPLYKQKDTHESIRSQKEVLDWLIDQIIEHDESAQIDLIGFSLGGVVASYWASQIDSSSFVKNHVRTVILINSPVGGIPIAGPLLVGCKMWEWQCHLWSNVLADGVYEAWPGYGRPVLNELQLPWDASGNEVSSSIVDELAQAPLNFSITSIQSQADYLVNDIQLPLCQTLACIIGGNSSVSIGRGTQYWPQHNVYMDRELGGEGLVTKPVSDAYAAWLLSQNHNAALSEPETLSWVVAALIEPDQTTLPIFSCSNVTEIPQAECEALVVFYNTTDGPHWRERAGWLDTTTPCRWHGVGCRNGHVVNLDLMYNQLNGSLPPELGNLIHLQSLTLHLNVLYGTIPPQLGNLTNLTILNLHTNHNLSGSIPPELGNLTNLRILDLSNNQLSGSLPPQLANLQNLSELSVGGNQLSGAIPPEIGNLTNLDRLFLTANQFNGPLPLALAKLTNLNFLWFERTNLCEPATAVDFQTWLHSIHDVRGTGVTCSVSIVPETPTPAVTPPPITTEACVGADGVYTCTILANGGWQQTPLWLPASTNYYVTYKSGSWTTNIDELSYVDLNGYLAADELVGEPLGYEDCVLHGIDGDIFWSTGTMVGRVGDQSGPIRWMRAYRNTGYLSLRINEKDECLVDNDGAIIVEVSLFPPASEVPSISTSVPTPTEQSANPSDLKATILEHLRNAGVTTNYSQEAQQLVDALFVHFGEFGQNGGSISQEAMRQALQSDDVGIRLNAVVQGVWGSWVERAQREGFDPSTTDPGTFADISPFRQLITRLIQGNLGPLSAAEQHALYSLLTRSEDLQTWRDDTNGIVGAINRESFQAVQREQPTSIPIPNAPPTPPTASASPFQIISPGDGTILRCKPQFAWQDSVGLAPGHLYEIVIWKVGEDWKKGRGVTSADLRTSRDVDLNYLDDQRDWFEPGEYEWGILDITTDPYSRHSMLGYGGRFTFVRDGKCL